MEKKKLDELLSKRFTAKDTPVREVVEPVNLYAIPNERTDTRTSKRTNDRTDKRTVNRTDTDKGTILTELKEGTKEAVRKTQRYSFEIYEDQKNSIEELQYKYKKKTDKKIGASSIIREALDIYLEKAKNNL